MTKTVLKRTVVFMVAFLMMAAVVAATRGGVLLFSKAEVVENNFELLAPALENPEDNTVTKMSAGGKHTFAGNVTNSRSIAVLDRALGLKDTVKFTLKAGLDNTITTNTRPNVGFSLGYYQSTKEGGSFNAADFDFAKSAGNGFSLMFSVGTDAADRAVLYLKTPTNDLCQIDSTYGNTDDNLIALEAYPLNDGTIDLGWAMFNNSEVNFEIGYEKVAGVARMYIKYTLERPGRNGLSGAKFIMPLTDIVNDATIAGDYYLGLDYRNLVADTRAASYEVSNVEVIKYVVDIAATPEDIFLVPNKTKQLLVKKISTDTDITSTATFTSNDEAVATVDTAGLITAVGNGNTTISIAYGDDIVETSVSVASSVTTNVSSASLAVNEFAKYTATTSPSGLEVLWSSSDTSIATVSASGMVMAKAEGSATITATVKDFTQGENLLASNIDLTVTAAAITENVYGTEFSKLYSDNFVGQYNVNKTAKGYTASGKTNGKNVLALNRKLNITSGINFDMLIDYDVTDTVSNYGATSRNFGIYFNKIDKETDKFTASDFSLSEDSTSGAQIEIASYSDWWSWGGKFLLHGRYRSESAIKTDMITSDNGLSTLTGDNKLYGSALARTFAGGGRIHVDISSDETNVYISLVPMFFEGEIPVPGETSHPDDPTAKIGPVVFAFPVTDFDATADYYLGFSLNNNIEATKANVSFKIENIDLQSVSIDKTTAMLKPEQALTLNGSFAPATYRPTATSWTSSDTSVATVSSSGVVTAVGKGKATIKYIVDGLEASCEVTVVGSLSISDKTKTMQAGDIFTLTATTDPSVSVVYSSSDDSIATVDSNGVVTAIKDGEVTISVKVGDLYEETCKVTVKTEEKKKSGCKGSVGAGIAAMLAIFALFASTILIKKRKLNNK